MSDLSRMLGDAFKAARGKTGLSQQQVGRAAGVDYRTVLDIENYRGNPTFSRLYALIRVYKMDPRIIFYPELQQESPAISQLKALINDCTEEEAYAIYPVVLSAINMLRNSSKNPIE